MIPINKGILSEPVRIKINGRFSIISARPSGAAAPAYRISVYAVASTPFSSIDILDFWEIFDIKII